MFRLLRSLLRRPESPAAKDRDLPGAAATEGLSEAPAVPPVVETQKDPVLDEYFRLHELIEGARTARDYRRAIELARQTYTLLPRFAEAWKSAYGRFDIQTSVAVDTGATLMAVMGDRAGIEQLREVISQSPELARWQEAGDRAAEDADLVDAILDLVAREAGVVQRGLKKHLGVADGQRLGRLAQWLEKAGRLRREPHSQTYRLFIPSPTEATAKKSTPPARRFTRSSLAARLVDLASVPKVSLPRSPVAWEERRRSGQSPRGERERREAFSVTAGKGWSISAQEKLRPPDRPDPALKGTYACATGTVLGDPTGRARGFESCAAAIQLFERDGREGPRRGLAYDTYRTGVNPLGKGVVFMSRDCVLHAYDAALEPILELSLPDIPEVAACVKRLAIGPEELRRHIRCVALSVDHSRCLFTIVDEAWCMSITGDVLWGVRVPLAEGWTRVVPPTSRIGTDKDIDEAMALMSLSYPLGPEDVKRRYRELAKQWHPDLHPSDDRSERMQKLNAAADLLAGADLSALADVGSELARYEKVISHESHELPFGMRFEMSLVNGGSEKTAADWIYAASFAANDQRSFVATYSGNAIELSPDGQPLRAYSIGTVPFGIADTGDYLYFLTDTRLYVLSGERLQRIVDVLEKGELLMAETGFGLLAGKALHWFHESGEALGAVVTKDPIRRVYSTQRGLVVETRQHRAIITGAPSWWAGQGI